MGTNSDAALVEIAIYVCVAILGVLILFIGFRLLLPFRSVRSLGRLLAARMGPFPILLCGLWTIALVPAPFVFLWGWLIRFGQALLVDTPRQVLPILTTVSSSCSLSINTCLTAASGIAGVVWSTAISEPAKTMQVPPDSAAAALVFVAFVTVMTWYLTFQQANFARVVNTRTGPIIVLALSFAAALYLCITSILAIPVFSDRAPDIAPFVTDLTSKLTASSPPRDAKFPNVFELSDERATFPASLAPTPKPAEATPDQSAAPPRPISFAAAPQATLVDMVWSSQTQAWDQTYSVLKERAGSFGQDAADFSKTAISFFLVSDEGHIDTEATRRHVTVLANSYCLWLADYRAAIDQCVGSLRSDLGQLRTIQTVLAPFAQATSENSTAALGDQLRNLLPKNSGKACSAIKPVARDYLPTRSGPTETLGLFGFASAWLLKTESPELALIVGLLGFGFFGALATSFIREFRGTPGNELPSISFIMPALIRGIGAAVLVFLLAKGGAAIFTKGDATPNAYAIFFACFVAAVFSDDVWLWARNRQRNELGGSGNAQQGDDASKAGHKATHATPAIQQGGQS
jgi:hypothetical protein